MVMGTSYDDSQIIMLYFTIQQQQAQMNLQSIECLKTKPRKN